MSPAAERGPVDTSGDAQSQVELRGPGTSLQGAVLRGAGIILVVTIFARIAGFARNLVFGASVGAGEVGTAYASANLLPNVLFEVVAGGALAAVVVPLVSGLAPAGRAASREERSPKADAIVSALLTWTVLAMLPLMALLIWFAEPLAQILLGAAPGAEQMVMLGADLLAIFAVQLPLYGIAVVLGAYLQSRRLFFWPAVLPLLSSIVVMISYRLYALVVPGTATAATLGTGGTMLLGWGTTAGVLAMALPVLIVSHQAGFRYRPSLRLPAGTGRSAAALAGSGLGAVGAQQLAMAMVLLLAMRAGGTGTLVVFQYAYAVFLLPFAVLVVPIMTSTFPHLSEQRLTGDTMGFARTATSAVRLITGVAVLGTVALVAAAPAIEAFFRQLDRAAAQGVGPSVAALALGLCGYAVTMQCTRILSAALRTRDALLVGSVGWVIAAVGIVLLTLTSPTRPAAEAATAFSLCIAVGMLCAAALGMSRLGELVASSGQQRTLRRIMLVTPVAVAAGAIPGHLVVQPLLEPGTSLVMVVLIGVLAGIVAVVLAAAVLALANPAAAGHLLGRVRSLLGRRRSEA